MTEEQEKQLTKELNNGIANIVLEFAEKKLDPEIVAVHLMMAATKVTSARCMAIMESCKSQKEAGEKGWS